MPQNHCPSYTAKVATLASAGALWIGHSRLISDHFLYEDSEDENSDSEVLLDFMRGKTLKIVIVILKGFKKVRYISLFEF
jgi:hypothetical protein